MVLVHVKYSCHRFCLPVPTNIFSQCLWNLNLKKKTSNWRQCYYKFGLFGTLLRCPVEIRTLGCTSSIIYNMQKFQWIWYIKVIQAQDPTLGHTVQEPNMFWYCYTEARSRIDQLSYIQWYALITFFFSSWLPIIDTYTGWIYCYWITKQPNN